MNSTTDKVALLQDCTAYFKGSCTVQSAIASFEIQDNTDKPSSTAIVQHLFKWSIDGGKNWSNYASIPASIAQLNDFTLLHLDGSIDIQFVLRLKVSWPTNWRNTQNVCHDAYELYGILVNEQQVEDIEWFADDVAPDKGEVLIGSKQHLYKPYDFQEQHVNLERQMVAAVNEHLSHTVVWFSHEETDANRVASLRQFNFIHTGAVKFLPVIVVDNNFNIEQITYDAFDIDFERGLELHITVEAYERVFGEGKKPQQNDFFYIPIINHMLEVVSVQDVRGLMHVTHYWSCVCKSYEHRNDLRKIDEMQVDTTIEEVLNVDELANSFKDWDAAKATGEQVETAALNMFVTPTHIDLSMYEAVRQSINKAVAIIEERLIINDITVSGAYYDMQAVGNAIAVEYAKLLPANASLSACFVIKLADKPDAIAYQQIARIGAWQIACIDRQLCIIDTLNAVIACKFEQPLGTDWQAFEMHVNCQEDRTCIKAQLYSFSTMNGNLFKPTVIESVSVEMPVILIVDSKPVQLQGFLGQITHFRVSLNDKLPGMKMLLSAKPDEQSCIADDATQILQGSKAIIATSLQNANEQAGSLASVSADIEWFGNAVMRNLAGSSSQDA